MRQFSAPGMAVGVYASPRCPMDGSGPDRKIGAFFKR